MSRIYFHSEHGTAEVSGRERASMGVFCSSLLLVALGLDRAWLADAATFRRLVPPGHYTQHGDDAAFLKSFQTWLAVGGEGEFGIVTKAQPWVAGLNTALVAGSDPVRLMARLHGQCEIHAYVEGPNRSWLATIIETGRTAGIFRPSLGWESVVELLRSRDDAPVVTSYSVCQSFPNPTVAGWTDDREGDGFYDLPEAERWSRGMSALRQNGGGLELTPNNWGEFYFDNGANGFTIAAELWNDATS